MKKRPKHGGCPRASASAKDFLTLSLLFTALFFAASAIVFYPFVYYGKAFLWATDGIAQHIPTLVYTRNWLKCIWASICSQSGLTIPYWDSHVGMGVGVYGNTLGLRFVNFLYALFPESSTEDFLVFRSLLNMYLSGFTFLVFVRTKTSNRPGLILGALAYAFSGFALFFAARHAFFLEMTIFFPLFLLGVDQILQTKRSPLLVITVALSAISYFYFLYILALCTLAYFIMKYGELNGGILRKPFPFFSLLGVLLSHYIAGMALGAFALLPALINSLSSSRLGSVSYNPLFWDGAYYIDLFVGQFDMTQIGLYGFVAMPTIAMFCFVFAILNRTEPASIAVKNILLLYLVLLLPILAVAFNGFSGKSARWCFAIAFWLSYTIAVTIDDVLKTPARTIATSLTFVFAYLVLYAITCICANLDASYKMLTGAFGMLALWLFANRSLSSHSSRLIASVFCIIFLLAEIGINSYQLFSPDKNDYISEFADTGATVSTDASKKTDFLKATVDDLDLYRVDYAYETTSEKYEQLNYGVVNAVNGISSYYSFLNKRQTQENLDLGNSQQDNPFLIYGFDQRSALEELASVKYLVCDSTGHTAIPYGFVAIRESDGLVIYENQYALPLIYAYDFQMERRQYESLPLADKEQALLQCAIVDKLQASVPEASPSFCNYIILDDKQVFAQIEANTSRDNIEILDGGLLVKTPQTQCTLTLENVANSETHIEFTNLDFSSLETNVNSSSIAASSYAVRDTCILLNQTAQYYYGARNCVLNLGASDGGNENREVTLSFSAPGYYYFGDVRITALPMNDYTDKVEKLLSTAATDVSISTNKVYGTITAEKQMIACIAVPFSAGWRAWVNGCPCSIMPINGYYMGIPINPGQNDIVLEYTTPGLRLGCAITIATAIICGIMSALRAHTSLVGRIASSRHIRREKPRGRKGSRL